MVTICIELTRRKLWAIFKYITCHSIGNSDQIFSIFAEDKVVYSGLILFKGNEAQTFLLWMSCWVLKLDNKGNYIISFEIRYKMLLFSLSLSLCLFNLIAQDLSKYLLREVLLRKIFFFFYRMCSSSQRNSSILPSFLGIE